MKIYEVNYDTISDWIPWDKANASKYVKAETVQQAKEIAIKILKIKPQDICFISAIETIN